MHIYSPWLGESLSFLQARALRKYIIHLDCIDCMIRVGRDLSGMWKSPLFSKLKSALLKKNHAGWSYATAVQISIEGSQPIKFFQKQNIVSRRDGSGRNQGNLQITGEWVAVRKFSANKKDG